MLAVAFVQWFVILHECGHDTLFRTRTWNRVAGSVAGFFALIPFACWTRVHSRHHRWTGWQDLDPTTEALVPRNRGRVERAASTITGKDLAFEVAIADTVRHFDRHSSSERDVTFE